MRYHQIHILHYICGAAEWS